MTAIQIDKFVRHVEALEAKSMKGAESAAAASRAPVSRPPLAAGSERAAAAADIECSVIADRSKEGAGSERGSGGGGSERGSGGGGSERADAPRSAAVNLLD